jgi:hypothetical protein
VHEQTITFPLRSGPHAGFVINTPGIYGKRKLDEDMAHNLFLQGKLPKIGTYFKTIEEAEQAAVARSKLFTPNEKIDPNAVQQLLQDDFLKTIHWPYR